jgi:hypothetical protein
MPRNLQKQRKPCNKKISDGPYIFRLTYIGRILYGQIVGANKNGDPHMIKVAVMMKGQGGMLDCITVEDPTEEGAMRRAKTMLIEMIETASHLADGDRFEIETTTDD